MKTYIYLQMSINKLPTVIIRDIKPGDEVSVDKLIRDMELGHASTPISMVAIRSVAQFDGG